MRSRSALLLALLVLALAGPARAQEQQDLDALKQEIESGRSAETRIAGEIAAAIEAQDQLASQLAAIAAGIQAQEALIAKAEGELKALAGERALILAELGEKQDALSGLLAGLQRLQRNPPPALVVAPDDILAALRGAMLMGTLAPELGQEAQALSLKLGRLQDLGTAIAARREAVASEIARLEAQRGELGRMLGEKKTLVSEGSAALEARRKRTSELARKARSLQQLLDQLAEERKREEDEALRRKVAAELERKRQEELQRRPKLAFAEARGKLVLPAQGEIVRRFGEPDGLGREVRGLMIATRQGAQVTSPADGKVEFAGPFRSYGEMVIVNPGGGYRVLIAGMDKVTANVGEFLRAGEPVGEMGSGPASVTLFGEVVPDGRPVLYIEFRNSTGSIDSGPWWIGGMKEARG